MRPRLVTVLVRTGLVFSTAVVAGIALSFTGADMAVTRGYFQENWATGQEAWAQSLYDYAPGFVIAGGIGCLLCGIWIGLKHRRLARGVWFLPLLIILGPGLLVNGVGKEHWGRPRPRSVVEFGGKDQYRTAGLWQTPGPGRKSFPSGHASMGFSLVAGFFVWRGRRPVLASTSLYCGIVAGLLVGWARVAQGGHFVSDILWSGAVVFISGELLAWAWLRDENLRSGADSKDSGKLPAAESAG